jgi:hypothetical protein
VIKYAELNGYNNCGELGFCSHLYEFIQKDEETPIVILIHAFECPAEIFKGYVFNKTKSWKPVLLTDEERTKIEFYTGHITEVDFPKLVAGTIADEYRDYTRVDKI